MSKIEVGIIMGSDSDLPVMQQAADILKEFGIDYEVTIVSAHRTPERLMEYAAGAAGRGLEVIIAGGMVAAVSVLPVIGVPVNATSLQGLDSLLSIVQMPRGVPVATVAINNAQNAGILAAQILGIRHPEVRRRIEDFKRRQKEAVLEKASHLEEQQRTR